MRNKVVLDTNCLIASISRRGNYYRIWSGLQNGDFVFCYPVLSLPFDRFR